ncbi:MAG TPA: hypothetical protein VH019_06065 [Rhizomicrobium sp.]|jgi:hypothetical protein|nr:hypothetical protein [Rhizomicrobium sp.]
MAATDILSLKTSMAERAIRWLYALALILITLGVIFGVWRGAMLASRPPMTNPPAMADNTNAPANAMTPQAPQPGAQAMRPMGSRGFYRRGFERRFFMMRHHPMRAGIFMIIGALVRGFIALMIVRILAELGLAILAIPRRT